MRKIRRINYKTILKIVGCIIGSVILGCLSMILVYLLPVDPMAANIARSSALFDYEGVYPAWAVGYKTTQLDNWTEGYVLCSAIYPGENPVEDAMSNPIIEYVDESITLSLTLQANKVPGETIENSYGRYWHGLLLLLKPLLLFFDIGDIRILNMMLQLLLVFLVVVSLIEKGYKRMLLPFFLSLVIINPVTIPMSFTFSAEYLLMLLGCLVICNKHYQLKEKDRYYLFFCILGVLTAFFNEMSYPVVTLGIPLFMYLAIEEKDWKQNICKEIMLSASWAIGYIGMWGGKWICASLLTKKNYILDAFSQANSYVAIEINEPTAWDRVFRNIMVIGRWPYLIIILGIIIFYVFKSRKYIFSDINWGNMIKRKLPFAILAVYPILVFIALGNGYSYVHYWFSYRTLAITVMAGVYLFDIAKEKEK